MSKNYRNKDASHQDHLLVKAFKIQLLKTKPEAEFCHGYIPIWIKRSASDTIREFEYVHRDGFILPRAGARSLRSILNKIRTSKPIPSYEYKGREGKVTKPITDLTEADLVRSLKKLSLVLYSAEDEKKWIHFGQNGEADIILLAEQLKAGGRLGKIPLRKLLFKFCSHISRTGEIDWDLDKQLINEHRLPKSEVEAFVTASQGLKLELKKCGKDKEAKAILKAAMEKMIKDFCEQVDRGAKRAEVVISQETPVISTPALHTEDPELRRQGDINTIIRKIATLEAVPYKTEEEWGEITALCDALINDYGLSKETVDRRRADARWERTFPKNHRQR